MSCSISFAWMARSLSSPGHGRGLGFGMATGLAQAGADIIGVSRAMESSGSEVEKAVTAAGRRFWGYSCDFSDRTLVRQFIHQVTSDHPQIDILVNNAGTIKRQPAVDHSDEFWDEVIETNLNSQWLLTQAIGQRMVQRGSGKIIFVASLLTFQGGITVPGYAASKGAIGQLTKALANEWAGQRRPGERHRPRIYGDRQHRRTPGRSATRTRHPGAYSGGPLGHAGRHARRGRLSGVARLGLRQRHDPHRRRRLDGTLA